MITLQELNKNNVQLSASHKANLDILHTRINLIRSAWGKPMTVTSGVRSMEDHKRIYADIAKKKGGAVIRIPMGSKHLSAAACDIADPDGSLMEWCKDNVPLLTEVGLWMEDGTKGWCHFQIVAPGSGNRFFKP